jgi:outer membrane biogenesis lipoprotein LolB
MKIKYQLILLLVPIISFYCSSSKEIKKQNNDNRVTVSDLVMQINDNSDKLKSLKGSGSLTIEAPGEANSGSFTLNLLKPDSVSLKINGPFGISAAKVFISRDTFLFYNAFENMMVTGKTSGKNLGSLLNLKIEYEDIISILSCFPDFHREGLTAKPTDTTMENEELILTFPGTDVVNKYWVNPEGKYITKRVTFNDKGKVLREERYQNYKMIENNWMPRSILVILHAERQSLSLFYDKQEINSNSLDFSFNIPDGIKVVHWK